MKRPLLYLLALVFLSGCTNGFKSEKELYEYLSDKDNGITREKDLGNLSIKVKYLPTDYLVYNDVKKADRYTQKDIDSLRKYYKETMSFLITLDFKQAEAGENVLFKGASGYEEYKDRIEKLNFSLDEYVYIKSNQYEFKPVLWTLENSYTVGNKRNILVVFENTKAQEYDLVFNDEIFNTGISHYVFEKETLEKIPTIKFWKYDSEKI